jgi:flagellar motor switch/type III secretory pathway protein FliN
MTSIHPLAPPVHAQGHNPASASEPGALETQAGDHQSLVPSTLNPEFRQAIALTAPVARLPVELEVSVPVSNFRVRNLLALEPSHLIESGWAQGEDMPLSAGAVQLAWTEFEVVDSQLAVRVTRMA